MMANPCGRERLGFSIFRSRQQAARDRRFCITWINRMVNKEVERRIAELRSEFFLMSLDLFEMVDENHAQWLEAMVQILRECSLHHITVDRDFKTSSWIRQMEEGNSDEEDAEPLDQGTKHALLKKMMLRTFSDVFTDGNTSESETSSSGTSDVSPGGDSKTRSSESSGNSPNSDTIDSKTSGSESSDSSPNSDTIDSKTSGSESSDSSPNSDTIDSKISGSESSDSSPNSDTIDSKISGSESSDSSPNSDTIDSKTSGSESSDSSPNSDTSESKTSGSETRDVSPGCDTSSQPAESDQQENQTGTSQLMKKNKRISKNPFLQNPSSMTSEGEEERVLMNGTNKEEPLLTEREWKEWMDEQEMRGNVKTFDQQNAEEQRGAAPPTPEKATRKKNVKGVGTVKKIKTYLGDLFSPQTYHKWERLEDED
ncbi:dentin sialophosphoprotein-like isoform X2 [Acanthopagrus latus]|nr:dentin sialophosphoprotein-like isoform X2 [Acanthopagrus latus]